MEEYTLVWLPRNRRKALKLKVSGSEFQTNDNQHKINCKSKQNTDKFQLGQPKGDWIWNPFQFRRLGEEIGSSQTCPEVEVMELGPGEETRAGTKRTRIHQFWVRWVSTVRFHHFPCVLK